LVTFTLFVSENYCIPNFLTCHFT